MKKSVLIVLWIVCCVCGVMIGHLVIMSYRGQDIFALPREAMEYLWWSDSIVSVPDDVMLSYDQSERISLMSWAADHSGWVRRHIRRILIAEMIERGYVDFVRTPRDRGNGLIQLNPAGTWYTLSAVITGQDSLDDLIDDVLSQYQPMTWWQEHWLWLSGGVVFDGQAVMWLTWVWLFKDRADLDALWYEVISWRRRQSFDVWVRRYNIQKSFDNFGGVRILNTSGVLSFFGAIQYDPQVRKQFRFGKGIVWADIVEMYAGGICGASTALLQGTLFNSGIVYNQLRNHSKRYTNLYRATINGKVISTPWLDATVFDGTIDFKISNRTKYPIIIVANFWGKNGDIEEVFTLGRPEQKGTLTFVGRKGTCLTRLRHGETIRSCYREIDPVADKPKPIVSTGVFVPWVDVVLPGWPETISYQWL